MSGVARRVLLAAVMLGMLTLPSAAMGAGPNDSYTQPRAVALDDGDVRTNAEATPVDIDDPAVEPLTPTGPGYCNGGQVSDTPGVDMTHTVWYRVTGDGRPITVDLRGSTIDTVVAVYRAGAAPSASTFVTCANDIAYRSPDRDTELTFTSTAGAGYLVQVGAANCGTCSSTRTGTIDFAAWKSPANDSSGSPSILTTGPPRSPAPPVRRRCQGRSGSVATPEAIRLSTTSTRGLCGSATTPPVRGPPSSARPGTAASTLCSRSTATVGTSAATTTSRRLSRGRRG